MADSPDKTLDTVRKLIQRTVSSTPRPEAESAAYRACVLIRKAGLEVVDPAEIDAILTENATLKQQVLRLEAGLSEPDLATITRAAQALGAQMAGVANAAVQTGRSVVAPPGSGKAAMAAPIPLTSKYRSACKQCGRVLNIGDPILWQKSLGSWCQLTSCYPDWAASQAALHSFVP
jgi:hypothetical protein